MRLKEIRDMGWIPGGRQGNAGSVGNTIEDLLEIKENNLPLANAGEWEIKAQREGSASLTTLLHCEPSPTALKFVPQILLPKYGWMHKLAGTQYPAVEMSFRQTIMGSNRTDRGFAIVSDTKTKRVVVSFDSTTVDETPCRMACVGQEKSWTGRIKSPALLGIR